MSYSHVRVTDDGWRIRDAIKAGNAFENSSRTFRGGPNGSVYPIATGELPAQFRPAITGADYIVWSYATPIAWCINGFWHTPDVKYSPTTSQHQGQVNTAICAIETEL
jgi:hypothetical protein